MSEEQNRARMYREAAEAYLGSAPGFGTPTVEAAGIFRRDVGEGRLEGGDEDPAPFYLLADFFRGLYGLVSPWARLHGYFLLAVAGDKVYALGYGGTEKFQITRHIATFDRGEVWLRSDRGGAVIYFEDRKRHVPIPGAVLEEDRGAAEVMAVLKPPAQEAAGLSE